MNYLVGAAIFCGGVIVGHAFGTLYGAALAQVKALA